MHNSAFETRKKRADSSEYVCVVCNMQFLRNASLQMHAKIHETQCAICKVTLKSKKALDAHNKSEHSQVKSEEEQESDLYFDFDVEVKMEPIENVTLGSP